MDTLPDDVLRIVYQWLDPRCHNNFASSSRRLYNFRVFRPFKYPKPLLNPNYTSRHQSYFSSPGSMYHFLAQHENQTLRETYNLSSPIQLQCLTQILRELIHQWNCFTCNDDFLYDYPLHITLKERAGCHCCTKYAVPFSQVVPSGLTRVLLANNIFIPKDLFVITEEIFTRNTLYRLVQMINRMNRESGELPLYATEFRPNYETEVLYVFQTPSRFQDRLRFLGKNKIVVMIPDEEHINDFSCIGFKGLGLDQHDDEEEPELEQLEQTFLAFIQAFLNLCDKMEIPSEPKETEAEPALSIPPVHTVNLKPEKKFRKRGIEKQVNHLQKSQQRKKHLKKKLSRDIRQAAHDKQEFAC